MREQVGIDIQDSSGRTHRVEVGATQNPAGGKAETCA